MSFLPHHDFDAPGAFAPVVLLHGAAASTDEWRFLIDYLAGRFPIITADASDPAEIEEIIVSQDQPVHLVGQDTGAIMALVMATAHPESVRSLSLIEPSCGPEGPSWALENLRATIDILLAEGDAMNAARAYVDFWNGPGCFDRSSHQARNTTARRAGQIAAALRGLSAACPNRAALAAIGCPALMITGDNARLETRDAARSLAMAIPFVRHETIKGARHHAQLTDPHLVHPSIGDFLVRVDTWWHHTQNRVSAAA